MIGRYFLFFVGMEESENLALDFRPPNIYPIPIIITTLNKESGSDQPILLKQDEIIYDLLHVLSIFSFWKLNDQKINKKTRTFLGLSKWRRI